MPGTTFGLGRYRIEAAYEEERHWTERLGLGALYREALGD